MHWHAHARKAPSCLVLQMVLMGSDGSFNPLKLLYLGREYPQGSAYFRERLKSAFMKNKDVTDPEKIKQLVARGDFVIKELEALYFLRKYRAMKKRYYEPEKWSNKQHLMSPLNAAVCLYSISFCHKLWKYRSQTDVCTMYFSVYTVFVNTWSHFVMRESTWQS